MKDTAVSLCVCVKRGAFRVALVSHRLSSLSLDVQSGAAYFRLACPALCVDRRSSNIRTQQRWISRVTRLISHPQNRWSHGASATPEWPVGSHVSCTGMCICCTLHPRLGGKCQLAVWHFVFHRRVGKLNGPLGLGRFLEVSAIFSIYNSSYVLARTLLYLER